MLAGLAAGLVAFAFAYLVGEPQVQRAIDVEHARAAAHGTAAHAEVVSRDVQRTLGLLIGTVTLGVALGGGFALAFASAFGRIGIRGARTTAAVLAAAGFAVVTLVPFTKYPANPPSASDPATLDQRTLLFFAMIAVAVAALVASVRVRATLIKRLGAWDATIVAGGVFLALVVVAQLIMPAVAETPRGFPADVLYQFRVASLGTSAVLWLTIGLGFGFAAQRLLAPSPHRAPAGAGRADLAP
jgi:predicted cobalt transporter CbtA